MLPRPLTMVPQLKQHWSPCQKPGDIACLQALATLQRSCGASLHCASTLKTSLPFFTAALAHAILPSAYVAENFEFQDEEQVAAVLLQTINSQAYHRSWPDDVILSIAESQLCDSTKAYDSWHQIRFLDRMEYSLCHCLQRTTTTSCSCGHVGRHPLRTFVNTSTTNSSSLKTVALSGSLQLPTSMLLMG